MQLSIIQVAALQPTLPIQPARRPLEHTILESAQLVDEGAVAPCSSPRVAPRTLPAADAHPRGHVFLHSRDYRHAGIEEDQEYDQTAHESPEYNVRQYLPICFEFLFHGSDKFRCRCRHWHDAFLEGAARCFCGLAMHRVPSCPPSSALFSHTIRGMDVTDSTNLPEERCIACSGCLRLVSERLEAVGVDRRQPAAAARSSPHSSRS